MPPDSPERQEVPPLRLCPLGTPGDSSSQADLTGGCGWLWSFQKLGYSGLLFKAYFLPDAAGAMFFAGEPWPSS